VTEFVELSMINVCELSSVPVEELIFIVGLVAVTMASPKTDTVNFLVVMFACSRLLNLK